MISAVTGFANRHRRGLAITAGITGGIYMMGKYAKSKLIEFQEKSSSERTAKEKYVNIPIGVGSKSQWSLLCLMPPAKDVRSE